MENEERVDLFQYYRKNGKNCLSSLFLLPSLMLNPNITDYQSLQRMGFLMIALYDETEGFARYYKNSLMIVYNPSVSFKAEYWDKFSEIMKNYSNFICENYYDDYVYGYWFKINPAFGENLRLLFKQGKYSEFPKNYLQLLPDTQQRICKKDKNYQKGLELKLGLEDGELEGCELESIADKESYTFKYVKTVKNE